MFTRTTTILLALAAGVLGCSPDTAEPGAALEIVDGSDVELVADLTVAVDAASCQQVCQPCPPNQLCTQQCTLVGNCTSTCTVTALCIEGYRFDTNACRCLPDNKPGRPDAGEPCGDVTCGDGMVCCNESCGICTEPGGFCTQVFCTSGDAAPGLDDELDALTTVAPEVEERAACGGPWVPVDAEVLCVPGYAVKVNKKGTCKRCVPAQDECTTDADCRLFSNYCGGCNCDVLATSEPDPVCNGDLVNCFADPCSVSGVQAVCSQGQCVAG